MRGFLRATVAPFYARAFAGETVQIGGASLDTRGEGIAEDVFDALLLPVREANGRVNHVHMVGAEVSERVRVETKLRESEARQAFLLKFGDILRPLTDAVEIQGLACHLLADNLSVDRAYYVDVDEARGIATVEKDYAREGSLSLAGQHPVASFSWSVDILRRGECHVVDDTRTSPVVPDNARESLAALQITSCMGAPLIKDGRLVGALCVTSAAPRAWSEIDINVLCDVGERIWAAIERARAEAALRESEEQFQQFGEATPDILWSREAETLQWDYLSLAFEHIYGLSRAEALLGNDFRRWLEFILPEDRNAVLSALQRARGGERVSFEFRIRRHSDGAVRWIRNTDFPIRNAEGRVQRIGGVGQDVTELKAIEVALTHSEQRLRTLVEGVPQLVWRAIDSGDWTWASPQWTTYTGQAEPDSHHFGWLELVHPEDRGRAMDAWSHALQTAGFEVEYRIRRASDGAYRWFQTRATPLRDREGEILEWLGTSTDIDDLRRLQERQNVMVAELQHRTRNLIAVVKGIANDTMRETGPTPAFRAAFSDRLSALSRVQGVLSRSEAEPITIGSLLRLELDALGAGAAGDRATIGGPEVFLRPSTVQTLALALHELATNARKHGALSHEGGRLAVTWRKRSEAGGERRLAIEWVETGLEQAPERLPSERQGGGYGRELIERALPHALGARTTYILSASGVRCTIDLAVRPGKGEP